MRSDTVDSVDCDVYTAICSESRELSEVRLERLSWKNEATRSEIEYKYLNEMETGLTRKL